MQRRIIGGDRLIISTSFVCPRRYARRPFNGFNDSTRFNGFSSVSIVPLVSLVSKIGRAANSIAVAKVHQVLPGCVTELF